MNVSTSTSRAISRGRKLAFALGEVGDGVAYQSFTFLVFTFYYTWVKLPVEWISIGFIAWSFWNSINDPLVGHLSDKTRSSRGRRIPWMVGGVVPLAIISVLLFTPPGALAGDEINFLYFLLMLFLFDLAYTCVNLNYNAAFSELFTSVKDRSEVGQIRIVFVIVSLVFAFVMPSAIIEDLTNTHGLPYTASQFILNSIVVAIIILVTYAVVLLKGMWNTPEFSRDADPGMSFIGSIKTCLKNRSFLVFLVPGLGTWIVNGILPTVIPLWATHVLHVTEDNSIMTGVILLVAFLVAAASTPFWMKVRKAKGTRFAALLGIGSWAITVALLAIPTEIVGALVVMSCVGFGLGGSLYFYDQCLAEIIDEDEVAHGKRRAGAYYGVISFIIRLSGVINFVIIGLMFSGSEWSKYTPNPGVNQLLAIIFLLSIYPAIVLAISFVGMWFYPIKGERLREIRARLDALHEEKRGAAATAASAARREPGRETVRETGGNG